MIISINYLFLIDKEIIDIAKILAFNIHGSLLPRYRGRSPHVWAIINNEIKTGITAHKIEEGCDTGPIISQIKLKINNNDTGGDLLSKFNLEYPRIIFETLEKIKNKTISFEEQNSSISTFFEKRNLSDGLIIWGWWKERIYNWVRAQSCPYSGAFSYYENKKIIIDEITFVDEGYHNNFENGLIVKVLNNIPYIKTPNGIIKITKIRNKESIIFKKLKKFL